MAKHMMARVFLFIFGIAVVGWLPMPLLSSMALAEDDSLANKLNLSLYGFVETSYTHNFSNPSQGVNNNRSFDGEANSFRPNLGATRPGKSREFLRGLDRPGRVPLEAELRGRCQIYRWYGWRRF